MFDAAKHTLEDDSFVMVLTKTRHIRRSIQNKILIVLVILIF